VLLIGLLEHSVFRRFHRHALVYCRPLRGQENYYSTVRRWGPQALGLFLRDFEQTLSFYGLEKGLWIPVRTNNPIERFIREIRRRIRPMGRFVNAESCKRLVT